MTGKLQPETAASATPSAGDPAAAPADRKADVSDVLSASEKANTGRRSRNPVARVRDEFRPRKKSTGARSTRSGRKSLDTPTPWPADQVERRTVAALIPYARNARRHRPSQIKEIAASIKEWGWTVPILIDEQNVIIAGHGRVLAAEQLGIKDVPDCCGAWL